jgi:cytoskeletal protein CcmA (bactofilin family)
MFNKQKTNPERGEMESRQGAAERNAMTASPPPPPPRPGAEQAPAAGPKAAAGTGATTVLAEGSKFTGKANVAGTFRVEGGAEGEIQTADAFVVGRTGEVKATVNTRRAVLNGSFRGKIEASDRVELQSGSRVEADIKARNMLMEDGVQFRGQCQIGG